MALMQLPEEQSVNNTMRYMRLNYSRGFTLMELLVVIGIIGILTSVGLISFSSANKRAKDGAVHSDISGIRAEAQLYYNTYSGYGSNVALDPSCTANVFSEAKIRAQISAADTANGASRTVVCAVSAGGADYAVAGGLSAAGSYYCVDSNGFGGRVSSITTVTSDAVCQ